MRKGWVVVGFGGIMAIATFARGAGYGDDIGFTRLKNEQTSTPTGAGVPVTQVEAPLTNSPTAEDYFPTLIESDGTTPDPNFTKKTITPKTPDYTDSSHATTVAGIFYGNNTSITPGITSVNVYNANDWIERRIPQHHQPHRFRSPPPIASPITATLVLTHCQTIQPSIPRARSIRCIDSITSSRTTTTSMWSRKTIPTTAALSRCWRIRSMRFRWD